MPSLKQASQNSYFSDDRLSIGVYIKGDQAVLIDSGIDADTAKKVEKFIIAKNKNCKIAAIINTHYHADHCGGNAYFQAKYKDVKIVCSKAERGFIECPDLEPRCFCGTAAPLAELVNKHMQAQPSNVTDVLQKYEDQTIELIGESFKIITLPGHTPGMIGVITPDNVFYCGDAIFRGDTFNKHKVLFYTDIKSTLETFEKIGALDGLSACVFYHGGMLGKDESLKSITEDHKKKVLETNEIIFSYIKDSRLTLDDIVEKVMSGLNIPNNVMQYTLTQTCVNAYLTFMQQQKKINVTVVSGKRLFSDAELANTVDIAPVTTQPKLAM